VKQEFAMTDSSLELNLENLDAIEHLLTESYQDSIAVRDHINLDEKITLSPEKRELLNILMDRMGGYLLEVSHIDSFLQYCDLDNSATTLSQYEGIMRCQKLCKKLKDSAREVLRWVVKAKTEFNESSCAVLDDAPLKFSSEKKSAEFIENETVITDEMMQVYQQFRDSCKGIHSDLVFMDAENMMNTAGRRLEVMIGKIMHIETEHEMNVLVDYGLFQYRKNGKNIVERYYDLHHKLYSGEKLNALIALKNARFSLLKVIKPVHEYGTAVLDPLTGETLLLIDRGIYQLAQKYQNYSVLTHYLMMSGFIMTTGASTPVNLSTTAGMKIQTIFEKLISHHSNKNVLDQASYFQYITDLFKTAIHEDVTKAVSADQLPFSYHKLRHHDG
jgi:hypothetical protein